MLGRSELLKGRRRLIGFGHALVRTVAAATGGRKCVGSLPRLLAVISGHGDFADYGERFRHHDSNDHCSSDKKKLPRHIFSCKKLQRHQLLPGEVLEAANLLFVGEEAQKWVKFVEQSEFFMRVCPK